MGTDVPYIAQLVFCGIGGGGTERYFDWVHKGWPVACHRAAARATTSSGKMTQVSHSFAVVICKGLGKR